MAVKDDPKLKQFLINTLRRASYRHPGRYKALKRSHIGRNEYFCSKCGLIHGRKEGQMDHIIPVVDPEKGWENLDVYAERMFCNEDGYARLCLKCHEEKTNSELEIRKSRKKNVRKD